MKLTEDQLRVGMCFECDGWYRIITALSMGKVIYTIFTTKRNIGGHSATRQEFLDLIVNVDRLTMLPIGLIKPIKL